MMKSSPLFILTGVGIVAACGGFLAGRGAVPPPPSSDVVGSQLPAAMEGRSAGREAVPSAVPTLRSTDTLDDLTALGEDVSYRRLVLWLMDATEADVAAYWNHHESLVTRNPDFSELIMIAWSRLNPEGALAGVKGTSAEKHAWWAWACHDPGTALKTAIKYGRSEVAEVARGIGEFHPKWLRENFDRIPSSGRREALRGFKKWSEVDDPVDTMEFLTEHGVAASEVTLKALVREDAVEALEWFKQSGSALAAFYGGTEDYSMKLFCETLAESNPEMLETLIDSQPSGAWKRSMEESAFRVLMESDLEGAIAQALATRSPRVGAARMAVVAMELERIDPERAFEVATDLFARHPLALDTSTRIHNSDGTVTVNGGRGSWSSLLLTSLVGRNPARAMEIFEGEAVRSTKGAEQVSRLWAHQDVVGFAEWVVERNDHDLTDRMAPGIVSQLQEQMRFDEAGEWARGTAGVSSSQEQSLLRAWRQIDPDSAQQWLRSRAASDGDNSNRNSTDQ